jgi:hypothetical protein
MMRWLWIECPQFTATVDLNENDTIIEAPPSFQEFIGKHRSILEYHLKERFLDLEIQEKSFIL